MARYKIILVDSDVISHFISVGQIDCLSEILKPNPLFVVDNVYKEIIRHPSDTQRKDKVDAWIKKSKINRIPFPFLNENIKLEFYRIKKVYGIKIGDGERACMAMARYGKEVIASSNFNDIKEYAEANGIEYIGCLDILYIAWKRGYFTKEQCNSFITSAVKINNARFPVNDIESYIPDRDLSFYWSTF